MYVVAGIQIRVCSVLGRQLAFLPGGSSDGTLGDALNDEPELRRDLGQNLAV